MSGFGIPSVRLSWANPAVPLLGMPTLCLLSLLLALPVLAADPGEDSRTNSSPAPAMAMATETATASATATATEIGTEVPDTLRDALSEARDLLRSGEYNAAILLLETLRGEFGDRPEILESLGLVYLGMHLWKEAGRFYRQAVKTRPGSSSAWSGLGIVYFEMQMADSARFALEHALTLDADDTDTRGYLGELALEREEYAEALAQFEMILEVEGETFDALTDLGVVHQRSGDPQAAQPFFERAVELLPENARARYNLAVLSAQLGDFHRAVLEANRALERDPENLETLRFLGVLYFENQICEEAVRHFKRVLVLAPMDQEVRIGLASCLHSLGKTDRAVIELKTLMNHIGEEYDLLLLIADFRLEQGRMEDALQMALRALALDPDRPDAHYLLGLTYRRFGMDDEAAREFDLLDQLREEERGNEEKPTTATDR